MPASFTEDRPLIREDVHALSSADALAQFFAALGYPADTRLPMTAEALGLNRTLIDAVRRVERLTTVDDALQIYLFELTSVTVAHTRALARAFRDRGGDFLLVLTTTYDTLDFVLLERRIPGLSESAATLRVTVRPRILSVNRRDPGRVALRVLRRFTFTEVDADGDPDPYAQFDKLSSAFAIAEWSEPFFNNRALFSDYYLNERLPGLPVWDAPERNQAYRQIRAAFARGREAVRGHPDQAQAALILPVLEALGFNAIPGPGGAQADLLLKAPGEGSTLAFALTYPWQRYLDGKDAADPARPEENPGAQVVSLLDEGVTPWAIVTNGKTWRLYSARAHSRATNYYEVDLEEVLALADPGDAFRYFYLLFRAAAFSPTPDGEGGTFLDWLLDESATYAQQLGERLKERVFERIFPHFARGFVQGLGGPEALLALPDAERQETEQAIFDATLTFLYRLLFLLYAESRDLLPVREAHGYGQVSLQTLKVEIAAAAGPIEDAVTDQLIKAYGDSSTALYDRLLALFEVIDRGSASRNVPVYNGGLFQTQPDSDDPSRDAATARFLRSHRIPDSFLAPGLDCLARDVDPRRGDLGFIDYKSLGVRQLGSIYEGLLEFKVRIAPETMAVVKGKKTEEIVPLAEALAQKRTLLTEGRGKNAAPRTLPLGTVYLENDRRERKATGSYYTPDTIVKYIVRHTVGPVLDEKLAALAPRMQETERRFRTALKHKRELEGVSNPNGPALLQDVAGDVLRDLFDVKVLDPAMGSGHFLVEAVDFITDRLVRFLDGYPFLATFFEGMRASILDEMRRQEVTVDPARLTDVTLLKRHVLKRCIYGVDLNPMAVELAKVSLWLDCFTLGAPLSFLDHHLRCGNSLIGAMAKDVAEAMAGPQGAGQLTFLTGPFVGLLRAAEIMRGISGITDVTLEQVRESGSLFKAFDRAARPYKQLLDIHVAQHFGVKRAAEFLELYGADALQADPEALGKPRRQVIAQARTLYEEKRFFHWDLEFPEVFIDLEQADWKENGGFDAVVGNPPYDVLAEREREEDLGYLSGYLAAEESLEPALGRKLDLYRLFVARTSYLIKRGGQFGLIVPMSILADQQASNLRRYLLEQRSILLIDAFPQKDDPEERVFRDAKLPTTVLVVRRDHHVAHPICVTVHPGKSLDTTSGIYKITTSQLKLLDPDSMIIPLLTSQTGADLVIKLATAPHLQPSGEVLDTYQGEINETIMDLLLSTKPKTGPRVLRGGNVQRYSFQEEAKQGVDKYVDEGRYHREISSDKAQHTRLPRIGYQRNAALDNWRRLIFGPLPQPCYCFDSISYYVVRDQQQAHAHLALLNSRLLEWRFRLSSTNNHVSTTEIAALPFRRIHYATPQVLRERQVATACRLHSEGSTSALLDMIEALLPRDPDGTFLAFGPGATGAEEKSDVVHDFLAYLAAQMIAMHKEKQARATAFWDDLAAATPAATFEVLRNKGKHERSLAVEPACRRYVDADSGSTRTLDESLAWDRAAFEAFVGLLAGRGAVTASLGRVYDKHATEYKALVTRIQETDDLIDQIVYRLYGLTEEEIAVVEGRR